MCIGCGLLCHWKEGPTFAGHKNLSGPNLLDELLNDFIWFSVFGPCKPMHLKIMTHSESVHLCAEFKSIYRLCPRTGWPRHIYTKIMTYLLNMFIVYRFFALYYLCYIIHESWGSNYLLYLLSTFVLTLVIFHSFGKSRMGNRSRLQWGLPPGVLDLCSTSRCTHV